MATVSGSIVIRRPVEAVFAFVTDARNNPLWQASSGLKETRQMPESPVGVGTRIMEVWQFMGIKTESITEVTEYEPNRKYTRRLLSGSSPIEEGTMLFEPVAEGTHWTFTALVQAGGVFAIAEPLLVSNLTRAMEPTLAEAKALLERQATEAAG